MEPPNLKKVKETKGHDCTETFQIQTRLGAKILTMRMSRLCCCAKAHYCYCSRTLPVTDGQYSGHPLCIPITQREVDRICQKHLAQHLKALKVTPTANTMHFPEVFLFEFFRSNKHTRYNVQTILFLVLH